MRHALVPLLCCPSCRGDLVLAARDEAGGHVLEGLLRCAGCGAEWPVVRGVPRFVPADTESVKLHTARAFGYEWTRFAELRPEYEQQFLDWIAPVAAPDFEGRLVLDAGCGKGRHLACAARFGAREAVGVDFSDAVESAFANTRDRENAHVVQADLLRLPFRTGTFDLAYSVGVLHHLPDGRAGFDAVAATLKPGGRMVAWVYGREGNGWIVHGITPLRELVTSRLPLGLLWWLSLVPAAIVYLKAKLIHAPLLRLAPALQARVWQHAYFARLARFSFREMHAIVFDHLVPPVSEYLSREELAAWFAGAGFRDVVLGWHHRNSWRGTGLKR